MDSKKKFLSTSQLIGIYLLLMSALGCESSTGYSNDWTDTIVVNDRYYRLQLLNPDTGETVVIRDSPKAYSGPRWSPDGQFIAYPGPSSQGEMSNQIYVTNRFGRGNQTITLWENEGRIEETPGIASDPVWSPDSRCLAFGRHFDPDAIINIYVATSDPSSGLYEVCLTYNPYHNIPCDWTPDGSRILFRSYGFPDGTLDSDGRPDLYFMNIDGSGKYRFIESDSSFYAKRARISPDGTQIAFIVWTKEVWGGSADYATNIYIINADGSNLRRVIGTGITGTGFIKGMCLSWSPDGTRLAYTAGEKTWEGGHVYIVNVDGTNRIQITSGDPIYFNLDWRPSG